LLVRESEILFPRRIVRSGLESSEWHSGDVKSKPSLYKEKHMKVFFENGVAAYSGKYNEVVYMTTLNDRLCLARKYSYPELGIVHQNMRETSLNLNKLYLEVDPLFLADLKAYAKKNSKENRPKAKKLLHPMPGPKAVFIQMMWAWSATDPAHVTLKTITLADIITLQSPCRNISESIEAGFIPKVRNYTDLNHPIVI
ncbi:MAG TPA: hypothetical protein PL124_06120, partial [Candidatus Cloacimonadota bacterium]|nr:hypothetical protein [Candidatus Cloacimonadota bacterium]